MSLHVYPAVRTMVTIIIWYIIYTVKRPVYGYYCKAGEIIIYFIYLDNKREK
jgi:hypothetical protein